MNPLLTLPPSTYAEPRPDSPGPAAYAPEKATRNAGPAFTMGSRPQERLLQEDMPAPGDYEVWDGAWWWGCCCQVVLQAV